MGHQAAGGPMRGHRALRAGAGAGGSRGRRIAAWISVLVAATTVIACVGVYGAYLRLDGNIRHEDLDSALGAHRPRKLNKAVNILLMGSDDRSGGNSRYGRDQPGGADTMMLLHLSPGGGQALVLSFPRDLEVPVRACKGRPADATALINSAFVKGGPTCSVGVVEDLTHIHIDHYVVVDFTGFKGVVNALHGVEICLPENVDDKYSKLRLSKGRHLVDGEQALAYVRTRHGMGDGSDTGRIKRQQQFMASVTRKTLSAGTLSDPSRMWALLQAATRSLSTDDGFDAAAMIKLGRSLQGITAGKIKFVTVPREPYIRNKDHDQLVRPAADELFDAVRRDVRPPREAAPGTPAAAPASTSSSSSSSSSSPSSSAGVSPATVRVRVWNATGIKGKARETAGRLSALGYRVVKVGTAPARSGGTTRIRYGRGAGRQALGLARAVNGVTPLAGGVTPGVVDLYIGTPLPEITGSAGGTALPATIDGELRADGDLCAH